MGEENSLLITICEVASFTVVFNTAIYKFPQIYNILSSGSSVGVSLVSVVLEMIAYSIMLTYQFAMEYPFHTYMENVLMVFQDWLLVLVMLVNRRLISGQISLYIALYAACFVSIAMYLLPEIAMLFAISMTIPMLCWSKLDQLVRILVSRDPGQLSTITWFIVVYDTAARMLTTAVITKDLPMFINLTSSEVFNVGIFFSIIYFNYKKSYGRQRRRRS